MRPDLKSVLMGLLVTFLWSSSYIFIKFGLDELSPFFFAAVRYSLASTILLLASFIKRKKIFLKSKWSLYFVVVGFFRLFGCSRLSIRRFVPSSCCNRNLSTQLQRFLRFNSGINLFKRKTK
jgi:drug/metabolite transporter (DMT)-like permease